MARSKRKRSGVSDVKASIIDAIETTHKQPAKKKKRVNATPNLESEYRELFKKFNGVEERDVEEDRNPKVASHEPTLRDDHVADDTSADAKSAGAKSADAIPQPLSNRKARLMNKPTLAELKSSVLTPQLIEKHDCDAKEPYFLASVKTSFNVVQVPSHWQSKRDYLSGRSLLEKKPFELPDLIKQTGVDSMRNTLPEDEEQEKLKEQTRNAVRPKLGKLDLDYKKLYDVFFKLGKKWKPDTMLPYGDVYYENRNLQGEARWRKLVKDRIPGRLSDDLRHALGLQPGQLPPWCLRMKDLGMPPSYPNMKIAGLNWDISNFKDNKYGKVSKSNWTNTPLFGAILQFDDQQQAPEVEVPGVEVEVEVPVPEVPEEVPEEVKKPEPVTSIQESLSAKPVNAIRGSVEHGGIQDNVESAQDELANYKF